MTEPDRTAYDELGVSPGAPDVALRARYRQRARQLHPDVAGEAETGEAMRRLNEAWAVLGDPQRRRRYDESIHTIEPPEAPATVRATKRRRPFLRPSGLVLLVLAVIFVVTAYAGSWPGDQGVPAGSAPTSLPGSPATGVVGRCLASRAADAVACTSANDGQILAEVANVARCPIGTTGHRWSRRPTVVCTARP